MTQRAKIAKLRREQAGTVGVAVRMKIWAHDWVFPPGIWSLARGLFQPEFIRRRRHPEPPREADFSRTNILSDMLFCEEKIVWVPVQNVTSRAAQAFSDRQHHLVRYLESGIEELAAFYQLHQPTNILGFYFLEGDSQALSGVGIRAPWERATPNFENPSGNFEFFGPVSNLQIVGEAARLDYVRSRIKKQGFREGRPGHQGQIIAQLLLNDDRDFRVVIRSGNHRTAALINLGWTAIPIHFSCADPPVRVGDLAEWPGVVDGSFAPETARQIFEAFFRPGQAQILANW